MRRSSSSQDQPEVRRSATATESMKDADSGPAGTSRAGGAGTQAIRSRVSDQTERTRAPDVKRGWLLTARSRRQPASSTFITICAMAMQSQLKPTMKRTRAADRNRDFVSRISSMRPSVSEMSSRSA